MICGTRLVVSYIVCLCVGLVFNTTVVPEGGNPNCSIDCVYWECVHDDHRLLCPFPTFALSKCPPGFDLFLEWMLSGKRGSTFPLCLSRVGRGDACHLCWHGQNNRVNELSTLLHIMLCRRVRCSTCCLSHCGLSPQPDWLLSHILPSWLAVSVCVLVQAA